MYPEKVIILNDRSEPLGGATSLALLSARLLHAQGMRVVYVTGDTAEHHTLPEGIRVVALGGQPLLKQPISSRVQNGLYNRTAFRLIREVIQREDTPETIYHLHGWAQTLSPAVFHALKPVAGRLVVSAHDFSIVCPNGSFFNFQTEEVCALRPLSGACLATHCDKRRQADKYYRVARMVARRALIDLQQTEAVIALIHPDMADWFIRSGASPDRLRTLRNPVTPFCKARVPAERNSEMFFIGRLEPEKGALLAVEAARAAGRRLRIIGDGPDRAELESRFPEVELEGWLDHGEIAQRICKARALIMPSRLPEPFGLVALEALQSGVPLVAFSDSLIAREAAGVNASFLAAGRSVTALTDAVRALEPDNRVADASHAGFTLCRNFSETADSWCGAIIDLYKEQIAQEPVRRGMTS